MYHNDALQGYHIVAAISQDTVNYQFSQLFKQKVIHDHLDVTMADTGVTLNAQLSAPTVNFNTPNSHTSVIFMLNMPSGQFTYWEGFGKNAKKHTVNFTDWMYAFHVDLNMRQIAKDAIKQGSAVPQSVINHLDQFNDQMFTIQHLFMDFENADFASYDPSLTRMKFPDNAIITPGQMTQFQNAIENYFSFFKGKDNPFILGYSIAAKAANTEHDAFTPTGATFSTFDDKANQGLNTLNFLVMTDHASFPSNPNAGVYASNWIQTGNYDGRFVIGSKLFWEQWLMPKISASLQLKPTQSPSGWSFNHSSSNKYTKKDMVKCDIFFNVDGHIDESENYTASVSFTNKSPEQIDINLSGQFVKKTSIEFQCDVSNISMWEKASIDWNATITITAGANGKLDLETKLNVPEASTKSDGNDWGKINMTLFPSNKTSLDNLGDNMKKSMTRLLSNFQQLMNNVNNRFVLPAGNVFFFKNAQMDEYGDILLDISYKSEH